MELLHEIELNGKVYVEKVIDETVNKTSDSYKKYLIGRYVVVRCRDAGVHAGVLVDYHDRTVVLKDSKRLWYWKAIKNSFLSGVSVWGITEESKTGDTLELIVLTESCEIIATTPEAEKSIRNGPLVPQVHQNYENAD